MGSGETMAVCSMQVNMNSIEVRISVEPRLLPPRQRRRKGAESPFTTEKLAHRPRQVVRAEVRPHARRENQFGIGALPEQKVAETMFATGADEQVDRGTERAFERLAGEPRGP